MALADRRDRARALSRGRPLVTGDLAAVTWLTGLVTDVEWAPNVFSAPPLVVLHADGTAVCVVSEDEAPAVSEGVEVLTFPGFALPDVDRHGEAARLALEAIGRARAIAAEAASLPGPVAAELVRRGVEIHDVGAGLRAERAVKDADEIDGLRAAIAVADAGQRAARDACRPGRTELQAWAETRAAMERAAGSRLPLVADFVTGERTAEVGGPPGTRAIAEADLLLVDLVPRVGAYWGDSCATVAVGAARPEVARAHDVCRRALERGVDALRPGARAGDVDALVRGIVEDAGLAYPHHTGHGLGLTIHEAPRIVPDGEATLAPGMVIALEPGAYGDGWGVRVEWVMLVTAGAAEVLSGHGIDL
jgi:Xaa-Pro dipeptidase